MKQNIFFIFLLTFSFSLFSQNEKEKKAIFEVLAQQEKAWNQADLVGYMQGYWHDDSLTFVGKSGLSKGWQTTLNNYQKGYSTPEKMGKLSFSILKLDFVSKNAAYMIGKWHLTRKEGDLSGHFTLLWKKIKGKWVIVSDHSS